MHRKEGEKMKKMVSAIMVAVLLAGLLLTGCRMEGSGNIETREFDFSDFTEVEIGSAFNFEINRSDSYGISVTMDDNMFDHMKSNFCPAYDQPQEDFYLYSKQNRLKHC